MARRGYVKTSRETRTIIMGSQEIIEYMGISRSTLIRWVKKFGFPVAKMPNGMIATSPTLIDAWLLGRSQKYNTQMDS